MFRIKLIFLILVIIVASISCNFSYPIKKSNMSNITSNPHQLMSRYKDIKVGFVFSGCISDKGWSASHNEARRNLQNNYKIKTDYVEAVVTYDDALEAIDKLIDNGCNVIATCCLSFIKPTIEAAKNNPDIYFFNCAGYTTTENVSVYYGKKYQASYLCGIVAGMRTKTNKIGYVAAMKVPEVIRSANAFALGVQSVNKDATINLKWTGDWYNPHKEKSNAIELINKDCDVIAQHQNSTNSQLAAQQARNIGKEVWCIGDHISNYQETSDAYLTAPLLNYTQYYKRQIDDRVDGKWKSSDYWGGIEEDIVGIDALSENCVKGTKEIVDKVQKEIIDGTEKIFKGPIYDNNNELRVEKGDFLTEEEIRHLDWFVKGIIEE